LEELPVVSLFGQVWLWSLLSFVAGVLVTWLVQVRPAKQRLAELEANRLGTYAGPARPQPAAPPSPSQVSSPMRDQEFDDWHVGARVNSDAVLAPPPPVEQMWPPATAQESPRSYEPPRPAEPYEPPRPAEPLRPLEPQRLIETPPPVGAPEPRQSNDAVPFTPVGVFGKTAEPQPAPEPDHDYDELPPALTRIPENAEPSRVVEPVEVPEEEKPRSLFQRLTPADEVQAEPVALNPAQEPTVFRRADLDELPDVPEIPADHARYQPGAPEVAPPQEEPTAPPEVEEWHPREVWREEEEEQAELDRAVEAEHEDELLDDHEEDFAADDALPATVETPQDDTAEDSSVDAESDVEETSVIPAGEVQRAIAAADARRDADRQPWPEHSLTGQFPIVTDDIASSKGQLGVEPDDPDYRRDDPDEPTAPGANRPAPAAQTSEPKSTGYPATEFISVQSLATGSLVGKPESPAGEPPAASTTTGGSDVAGGSEPKVAGSAESSAETSAADLRPAEPRTAEPSAASPRTATSESADQTESSGADSRPADSRLAESRPAEPRPADFRTADSQPAESRTADSRTAESRTAEPRPADSRPAESRTADSRTADSRFADSRTAESRPADTRPTESRPADSRPANSRAPESPSVSSSATEFFPATGQSPTTAPSAEPSRPAVQRAADFFAPQPVAEPAAPAPAAKAKPAPAQPTGERPRSLFEPIVGASDDDPEPAETVRHLPPSDDQPFVPILAPELLERGSNGLPQRPQRPAGGPPPMTSPPLLGPPQPSSPPPPLPPKRPRPVGFSPSTGGRSEAPAPIAPRFQQPEGFSPRSPFGPGSVLPKSDGHAPAADFEVKATLTGRRYFRPGTSSFNDTRADVWFRTEADAQKAGFRPAQ
jgi:hypothetical protein